MCAVPFLRCVLAAPLSHIDQFKKPLEFFPGRELVGVLLRFRDLFVRVQTGAHTEVARRSVKLFVGQGHWALSIVIV